MEIDDIKKKTRKQIIIVALVGLVLFSLDLIMSHKAGNVQIISENGRMYMIRPAEDGTREHLTLRAKIKGDNEEFEKKINVILEPYGKEKEEHEESSDEDEALTERERIEQELRMIVSGLNSENSARKVLLPSKLDSGEQITWKREGESNSAAILLCTIIIMFSVYRSRFRGLERKRRQERNSVMRNLPEFVNRLVLLLNAGLVLSSAFERSVEESIRLKKSDEDYFYSRLREIYVSVKTANASMDKELKRFARESGIRELMRISNIISDNISKGVSLADKLKAESELLWISRKKNCEAAGRLAETKLTLPLVIFLMVLIVITVAPALLKL